MHKFLFFDCHGKKCASSKESRLRGKVDHYLKQEGNYSPGLARTAVFEVSSRNARQFGVGFVGD